MWGQVRRALGVDINETPVMIEKRGKKFIFWFRGDGTGKIAEMVTAVKEKANVEIMWDDSEGLAGICVEKTVIRS